MKKKRHLQLLLNIYENLKLLEDLTHRYLNVARMEAEGFSKYFYKYFSVLHNNSKIGLFTLVYEAFDHLYS